MASVYDLKPALQNLLRPLTHSLARAGITANQVTIAAMALSGSAGAALALRPNAHWPLLVIPFVLLARMALNAIDGMLAREHGMKSRLGALLNELGDVLSDIVLYLPLARVTGIDAIWIVSIVLLAMLSEMTGVIAVQIGAERRYDGPMGKSDRATVFGFICLLLGLGIESRDWINYLLMAIAALLVLTIVNRARRALAEVA